MGKREPTKEQSAAIDAAGTILVSASAGSGKTYVMVEKLIRLILTERAEVSSVLAVTFTKLAAGEMKERLRLALIERINEESDASLRQRLRAQLSEIPTAEICTVHSFCTNVIRRYFYEAQMAGNFRVADEQEADKLKERAITLAIEKILESKEEWFVSLCRIYAGGSGFAKLKSEILKSYEKVISRADYREFLQAQGERYTEEGFEQVQSELFSYLRQEADRLRERSEAILQEMQSLQDGLFGEKHVNFLQERIEYAQSLACSADLFAAAEILRSRSLSRKPDNRAIKKTQNAEAIALDERMKSLKKYVDSLKSMFEYTRSREEEKVAFFRAKQIAAAVGKAVLVFDDTYAELKRRAGVLDFSDLEHQCLRLLNIPHVCEEVRSRYTHIFIDEYQDVNPVQEEILTRIAGENVFMVGDPKQSIYGFRGCSAAFFTRKFERLRGQGRALTLNGNFRSCENILCAVNDLFSQAMTVKTCSIDYAGTSKMTIGKVEQMGGEVYGKVVDDEPEKEKTVRGVYSVAEHLNGERDEYSAEATLIADVVLQELQKKRHDPERGEVPNEYGDIVVLTRNKTAKMERIVGELVRRGVPVAASAEVNVCDYPEVKTLIALLQYLDNAEQDIPLAASLKSALGNVTDAELAVIRLHAQKEDTFCAACARYAEGEDELAEKLRAFYARCDRLRLEMNVFSAAELLARILSQTNMELTLLAQPCGKDRVQRINRFCEACGDLSVTEFLEQLKSGGYKIGFSQSGGENAVRVMTMHASKGLEFPVVIVAGMNEPFSSEDMKGMLFDEEWGFASEAYDFAELSFAETIVRTMVKNRLRRKRAEDEMRLLYVALTRAKSTLYMIFSKEKEYDDSDAERAGSFADFVDIRAFTEKYPAVVFAQERTSPAVRILTAEEADESAKRAVLARYRKAYAHEKSVYLPVKTSASAIVQSRRSQEQEQDWRTSEEGYATPSDAKTGTAYHAFLELADFSAPPQQEAERVCKLLAERGIEGVDVQRAARILQLPVFHDLRGYTLYREREFLLTVPAEQLYPGTTDDSVLVQGVIDLMAVRGEECVLVDYKYSSHDAARLLNDYRPQLQIYAAAAARRPGIKNVKAYILNILRGFTVSVPLE